MATLDRQRFDTQVSKELFKLALLESLSKKLPKTKVAIHDTSKEVKILPNYTNTKRLRVRLLELREVE